MPPNDRAADLRWVVARIVLGAMASAWLATAFGPRVAQACLPMLQWSYVHLDTDNRLVELSIARQGAVGGSEPVYRLIVAPDRSVFVGTRLAVGDPQGRATVSMLVAYLWQAATIALPLALAWPARKHREWLLRLVVLAPALLLVALVDLPMALWAQVWQFYIDAFSPGMFSPLVAWANFLQGGGRLVLGVVAGTTSVLLSRRLAG